MMKNAVFGVAAGLVLALTASGSFAQGSSGNPVKGATASPPASPAPLAMHMVHPGWSELPTADQLSHFYPPIAQLLDLTGRVRLRCHVTTADTLDQCQLVSEFPKGLGFADAGMLLTPYFHLKPRPAADRTDTDFTIVPLRFALPPAGPLPPEPVGPAPSLRSVILARRLVAIVVGNADQVTDEAMEGMRRRLESEVADSILETPEAEKALTALEQSLRADFPAYREELAQSYARVYSQSDLARIVLFMESPVGRRWQGRSKQAREMHAAAWERLWRSAETQASTSLCKEIQCTDPSRSQSPAAASPE